MRKHILCIVGLMISLVALADKEWVDVTSQYISNPNYDNNNYDSWSGTKLSGYNPKDNAEHFSKTYDTYQRLTGLQPGTYRLSLNAFYRMGKASNDYSIYKAGNASTYQHAQLYATSSIKDYSVKIQCASEGKLSSGLGGSTSGVGNVTSNNWWGSTYEYYIPNNMEAAYYWFEAGYYKNILECEVGSDGVLTIGIRKSTTITDDWTCIDSWRLEYYADVAPFATASSENIIINEIMSANVDVYQDPSTNYGAWVEIYNPTDYRVNLGGLYVSDDPSNLKKYRLHDDYGIVNAHGYGILNFDHFSNFTSESYRQIDGKLDSDGGTIIISDGSTVFAQQNFPEAISRISYARKSDGGNDWGETADATPETTNNVSSFAVKQLDKPVVSVDGQIFTGSISFDVTIPSGATLRYTTDGSTPTKTNGSVSSNGRFIATKTTCYRFRLFEDRYLPSPVTTRTFICDATNEPFPIISVVTKDGNLFNGTKAIFAKSSYGRPGNGQSEKCNWNMDWDRPVNFEYITTDNKCVINQECNLSACGGWSRGWEPHSFKLKADKRYDNINSFDYQFFSSCPYLKQKVLQIRNGGNDTGCRLKDPALQEIVARSGLYVEHQAWQPVHVYVNGQKYAVLNMREPNNKDYGSTHYGIDTDEMDQFEMSPDSGYVQMKGTKEAFNRLYTLSKTASSEESYTEIQKLLDIDEYVNYMATEFYLGSYDWPQNNAKAFRDVNDGKLRFVLFDLDGSFADDSPFTTFMGKQNYTFDSLYGYDYSKGKDITGTHINKENEIVGLFKNLLNNTTFRKRFIDAFCLVAGSVMEPSRCKSIVNEMSSYESKGGYVSSTNTANDIIKALTATRQSNMISKLKSCTNMKLSSVTAQTVSIESNISEAGVLYNGIDIPTGKFSGKVFYPVTLTAKAPAGYKFEAWKTSTGGTVSTSETYKIPSSGSYNLIATWTKLDDKVLVDSCASPIKINEVSAANESFVNEYFKRDDWVELYNTTDVDVNCNGLYLSDNTNKPQKYQIPADAIVPAHGHLIVWCSKRDALSQLHASFKLGNDETSKLFLTSSDTFVANNASLYSTHPEYAKIFSDTITYCPMQSYQTVGRYPDGSREYYVMNHATIAASNTLLPSDIIVGRDVDPTIGVDAIEEITATNNITSFFTLSGIYLGRHVSTPGIYLVRYANGMTRKVLIK